MMGSGEQGVSICFTTLRTFRPQALGSQRDHLAHRSHGNDPVHPLGQIGVVVFSFVSGGGEAGFTSGLLAEAEFRLVAPHAVQDDGELARDSDTCPCHAATLGDAEQPPYLGQDPNYPIC